MSELGKITDRHRQRQAVVYVRQSTPGQMQRNTESAARQYALAERAVELGWAAGSVLVVDEDTGQSGRWAHARIGFRELAAEVGLGNVGVILALEVSRLARSSADWHQLLDLCALTGTLIADADGIYSPAEFNDRLLLGLKGTMSEDRCCSARQVTAELAGEGQRLPRRTVGQRRIRWEPADFGAVHDFLTNPAYAGTFAFGRRREAKTIGADGQVKVSTVKVPIEEWAVCIPEHHPGYVTWEQYLSTQQRLRANSLSLGQGGGAAREGPALLQGLLRCGKCGRKMMVSYSGLNGRMHRYTCSRTHQQQATRRPCQSVGGLRLDRTVTHAFLQAVTPAAVKATAAAVDQLGAEHAERVRLQQLALEQAEFEAGRRQRQFDACEPENRLVARTLEAALELALTAAQHERRVLGELERRRPAPLSEAERKALRRLTGDLDRDWKAQHSPDPEIAMVLSKQGQLTPTGLPFTAARVAGIRERANIPSAPRTKPGGAGVSINDAARQLGVCTQTIRRWLAEGLLPAEQTAPHAPWRIRLTDEVRARFVPDVPANYVKLDDAARQLGVARQTVLNQARSGRRNAVHVVQGKRRGLRIEIHPGEQGLLPDTENT